VRPAIFAIPGNANERQEIGEAGEGQTMKKLSALSIRQPYAEQVLLGTKEIEYRAMPTNSSQDCINLSRLVIHTQQIGVRPAILRSNNASPAPTVCCKAPSKKR
jgi:hypothetical protein